MWQRIKSWFRSEKLSEEDYARAKAELLDQAPIPVLWLFGKTGSGKSSIVRFLTGLEQIEIGEGFRPQTKFSSRYDFPDSSEPLLTFLDTRGIGEAGYQPQVDIAQFSEMAHLLIVPVRAMDHALDELLDSLKSIKKEAPSLPVILALTALHDAYPGEQHPEVDAFNNANSTEFPSDIHVGLKHSLEQHLNSFEGLFDIVVPLDLTPDFEGFDQPDFGGDRLKAAIVELLPAAYRHKILQMEEVIAPLKDMQKKRTRSTILSISGLAATAAAVPVPWIDIPVVIGLQTHLIYKLAKLHQQEIDASTIAQVTSAIGGRLAVRMAIREVLKFIPWVGMAANAAAAFAVTYAQGMAWNWYFTKIQQGHVPSKEELQHEFQDQLKLATELWQTTHLSEEPGEPGR